MQCVQKKSKEKMFRSTTHRGEMRQCMFFVWVLLGHAKQRKLQNVARLTLKLVT